MKIRINRKKLESYFILFPFLYPRGFSEYFPIYKQGMTVWLYMAILWIIICFALKFIGGKLKVKNTILGIFLYFVIMLIETLILQGGVDEGLQKVFATPALFMFFFIAFRDKIKEIISVIGNILLFDMALNCTVFCPFLLEKLLGENYITNINFIGHVQICAQIGILGITVAYLILNFGYERRAKILILLSLTTMLISGAIASYISIILLIIAYLLYNHGGKCLITKFPPKLYFVLGTILQAVIVPIVIYYKIDFGARYYVWIDGVRKLTHHYITGFGVYGVLIYTFWMEWTDSIGMNYAHNEVLQILLDGGITLLCGYLIMCLSLIRRYSVKIDRRSRYWFNCFLILFLIIGVCESVTEYNYFYIFLLLLHFLPEIYMSCFKNKSRLVLVYEKDSIFLQL